MIQLLQGRGVKKSTAKLIVFEEIGKDRLKNSIFKVAGQDSITDEL